MKFLSSLPLAHTLLRAPILQKQSMVKSEAGVEAYSCNLSPQEADTGLQIHNKDIKKTQLLDMTHFLEVSICLGRPEHTHFSTKIHADADIWLVARTGNVQ